MRKLLTWIVVSLGIAALVRRLRRRGAEPEPTSPPAGDPADELRQKLSESRSADEAEEAPPPPPPEATVEDRRADVHDQGRATLDEMRPSDEEQ
jgi:hypothetical protein